MHVVKAIALFLIVEFLLFLGVFVVTGTFATDGKPLELIADIATSLGTSVWDLGVGVFILGTFGNVVLMFVNSMRSEW